MCKFQIGIDKKYILYGLGGGTIKLIEVFKNSGYDIAGIIDKRAKSITEYQNMPVWEIDSVKENVDDIVNIIVIITVKNVFEHVQIARQLMNKGFCNLVYKPLSVLQGNGSDDAISISMAHDDFLVNLKIPEKMEIAMTKEEMLFVYRDRFIIEREADSKSVTTWLPCELLYNYDKKEAYGDIGMLLFYPLVELYEVLLSYNNLDWEMCKNNFILYSSEWVKINGLTLDKELEKSLVESRIKVFCEMQKMAEQDFEFFMRNAPVVSAKSRSHYNMLSSGRNRIAFQIAKGYKYVPVKLSKDAYDKWLNDEKFQEFKQYLEKNKIYTLFASIPHPMLTELPVLAVDYVRLFCRNIGNVLMKEAYSNSMEEKNGLRTLNVEQLSKKLASMPIAVFLQDNGTLSRYLHNNQFLTYRVYDTSPNDKEKEFVEKIDELLGLLQEEIPVFPENSQESKMLYAGVLDSRSNENINKRIIELTSNTIFVLKWEHDTSLLDVCEKKGFYFIKKMFSTIWDMTFVEGILLERQ